MAMIVYHFAWDLSAYQLIGVDVTADLGWRIFARTIAGAFLALVGINLVLATRNGFRLGPYFRRLAIILVAALLVSLGTWWLDPATFVFFGILHAIVVASILALPFLHAPLWLILAAAVVFIAGPYFLTSPFFDAPAWYWLGLSANPPATVDYVPIFPWFGVVLLGVAAGRLILANPGVPLWRWPASGNLFRVLSFAGRWSLAIYLIHQPVLIGGLMLIAPLLGPSQAALERQLLSSTRRAAPRSVTTAPSARPMPPASWPSSTATRTSSPTRRTARSPTKTARSGWATPISAAPKPCRSPTSAARSDASGPLRSGRGHVHRIDLVSAGDEEPVPLRPAEDEVRDALREVDAAEQVAFRREDVDAGAGRGPDVAVGVDPEAVGEALLEDELGVAALQCVVLFDLEGADVPRLFRLVGAR